MTQPETPSAKPTESIEDRLEALESRVLLLYVAISLFSLGIVIASVLKSH
jgi:hypothetical protein